MSLTDWQSWEPFVEALRRSAPPGTAVSEFVGTVGRGAWQGTYLDDGDADVRREHFRTLAREAARTGGPGPKAELDDTLRAVAELSPDAEQLVRVSSGSRPDDDVVELITLPPSVVSGPTAPVLEVVLEPGALPAQYRETIAPLPGAAPAPSADPDAVRRVIADRMPGAVGAAPEEIAAALPDGARLPEEVRALYAAAGSGNLKLAAEDGAFAGFEIVPLSSSFLREAFLPAARFSTWTADAGTSAPEDPAGRVQAAIGSPLWFPVGTDGAGNVYAVDLAPGENGHLGQVVFLDHELHAGAAYRAESLAALLTVRGLDKLDQRGGGLDQRGGGLDQPGEFLNLEPAEWTERLDAGTVPDALNAAGFVPDRAHSPALTDTITAANRLLELRGLEPIEVTRVRRPRGGDRGPERGPEPGSQRRGLLDRLFGR
ncbi:SMI1/KNR4 family protein [Promicromonospora soli]